MKKERKNQNVEMLSEYDFRGGTRGKHAARYVEKSAVGKTRKGSGVDEQPDPRHFELLWLPFSEAQRDLFRSGELRERWFTQYQGVCFDEADLEIARNQPKNHFFEWLGAVFWNNALGWNCAVEKFEYSYHPSKFASFRRVVPADVRQFVSEEKSAAFGETQCPDLLVFEPTGSDWFFCETKGEKEGFTTHQIAYFKSLSERTNKRIKVVRFCGTPDNH